MYCNFIITVARTVGKGVINVEENASWEKFKINAVPLVRCMREGTEGLKKMREEIEAENEGFAIATPVRWLENPRTIRERRSNREIAMSSTVLVVKGSKAAQKVITQGIKAAGLWY